MSREILYSLNSKKYNNGRNIILDREKILGIDNNFILEFMSSPDFENVGLLYVIKKHLLIFINTFKDFSGVSDTLI
jgi:hypothetical protein